jgi:hypothetical protein
MIMRDGSLILIPVDLSKTRGFSMIDSVISPAMSSLWLPVPCVAKIPFVPVPRRNPETSTCEVRKSVRDSSGVPRALEVVTVVKGVARAQRVVDDFTEHLTEEEKKSGVFLCWEYTTRRIG